jgi:hypothetical protein
LLRPDLCAAARRLEAADAAAPDFPLSTADDCFENVGTRRLDEAACTEIRSRKGRIDCITTVADLGDRFEACAKLADDLRPGCEHAFARDRRDPSVCERLRFPDDCFVELAQALDDRDLCARASDSEKKDLCYQKLAWRGEPSLCDRVEATATEQSRKSCYETAFRAMKNPAGCARLADEGTADLCMAILGGQRRDPGLCSRVKTAALRDSCWNQVAFVDYADACFEIQDVNLQRSCAAQTWQSADDARVCALLAEPLRRQCLEVQRIQATLR